MHLADLAVGRAEPGVVAGERQPHRGQRLGQRQRLGQVELGQHDTDRLGRSRGEGSQRAQRRRSARRPRTRTPAGSAAASRRPAACRLDTAARRTANRPRVRLANEPSGFCISGVVTGLPGGGVERAGLGGRERRLPLRVEQDRVGQHGPGSRIQRVGEQLRDQVVSVVVDDGVDRVGRRRLLGEVELAQVGVVRRLEVIERLSGR